MASEHNNRLPLQPQPQPQQIQNQSILADSDRLLNRVRRPPWGVLLLPRTRRLRDSGDLAHKQSLRNKNQDLQDSELPLVVQVQQLLLLLHWINRQSRNLHSVDFHFNRLRRLGLFLLPQPWGEINPLTQNPDSLVLEPPHQHPHPQQLNPAHPLSAH